jgi:alkanesulfonate monooxygenase SsuD/methylene tetrahydromethanopterin reductase-like flavin-dependent oxidoreductase (luciferase family)
MPLLFAPDHAGVFADALRDGAASRDPSRGPLDVAPLVFVAIGSDVAACRDVVRPTIARYVGAYGSRGVNFYRDLVARYGYGSEAAEIQDLTLGGRRAEGVAAVPDAMVDAIALVGPVEAVAERLLAYREAGVTTLLAQTTDVETVRAVAAATELGGLP